MTDFDIDNEIDKDFTAGEINLDDCYHLADNIYVVSSIPSCPVEYCGVVDNYCFYFKSRGKIWSFALADTMHQCLANNGNLRNDDRMQFYGSGRYSSQEHAAGDMPGAQAEAIIKSCIALWKSGQQG